jgi:hypothetical protein
MSTLELSQPGPLSMPARTAGLPRPPAVSSAADSAIRASTAAVVLAVAGIAAYISYWHAYAVVRQYGERGVTALFEPGTIDGPVYASSMVILHAARHRLPARYSCCHGETICRRSTPCRLHAMHASFVPGGLAGSALCRSGRYASLRSSR